MNIWVHILTLKLNYLSTYLTKSLLIQILLNSRIYNLFQNLPIHNSNKDLSSLNESNIFR